MICGRELFIWTLNMLCDTLAFNYLLTPWRYPYRFDERISQLSRGQGFLLRKKLLSFLGKNSDQPWEGFSNDLWVSIEPLVICLNKMSFLLIWMSPVIELIFGVECKDGKREVMRNTSFSPLGRLENESFLCHVALVSFYFHRRWMTSWSSCDQMYIFWFVILKVTVTPSYMKGINCLWCLSLLSWYNAFMVIL